MYFCWPCILLLLQSSGPVVVWERGMPSLVSCLEMLLDCVSASGVVVGSGAMQLTHIPATWWEMHD